MTASYVGRRLGAAAITILLIVLVNFLLFRAMPGSPERFQRNPNVTPALLEAQRARWGLDKPVIPDQLIAYVGASLRADLGYSYVSRGQTVVEVLGRRLGPTLLLFGLGEIIAIIGGLALGAYSGWRRGGPVDHIGNGLSLLLYSTPYFLLGMALLLIFATWLRWFPTFGMVTAGAAFASPVDQVIDAGRHLVLPVATVALGLIGQYAIVMRSSIVETMSEEYVTTARAKGLSDGWIRHEGRRREDDHDRDADGRVAAPEQAADDGARAFEPTAPGDDRADRDRRGGHVRTRGSRRPYSRSAPKLARTTDTDNSRKIP